MTQHCTGFLPSATDTGNFNNIKGLCRVSVGLYTDMYDSSLVPLPALPFSRIGLVVVSDNATGYTDDHLTELLTQHILENAIGNKTTPPLSQEDFREVRTCTDA